MFQKYYKTHIFDWFISAFFLIHSKPMMIYFSQESLKQNFKNKKRKTHIFLTGFYHFLSSTWILSPSRASLVAQMVKCLPVMPETWVQSLGQEDPLEKGMANHSSTLDWKIPWTEEPGRWHIYIYISVYTYICIYLSNSPSLGLRNTIKIFPSSLRNH